MSVLGRFVRRHVRRRPAAYQAYLRLPTRLPDGEDVLVEAREFVDELEEICEGRLDVHGTVDGMIANTDAVSADAFDVDRFDALLDGLETRYDGPFTVATVEKTCVRGGRLVRSYVVVPVRPLFPEATARRSSAAPGG